MNKKLVQVSCVSQDEVCKAIATKAFMFLEKFKKKMKGRKIPQQMKSCVKPRNLDLQVLLIKFQVQRGGNTLHHTISKNWGNNQGRSQ